MKIARDEEQAAVEWLNCHGVAPGVIGLHASVSALDAGTRKAFGQYLRLRRHRLHAPKVALEITADVHASLSEYVIEKGSVSLGEAIGRLLSAPRTTSGRSAPPEEIQALREALAEGNKEVADLRRSLAAIQQASPRPATRGKRTETLPLAVAPPCPLCGGLMRPEFANGFRLWVCMTATPSECAGTRPLDADLALSAGASVPVGRRWGATPRATTRP